MMIYDERDDAILEKVIKPRMKEIHGMKVKGVSDRNIAAWLGISERDFRRIKEEYEPLKNAYDDGMEILKGSLIDVVMDKALGLNGKEADEILAWDVLQRLDKRFSKEKEVKATITIEQLVKEIHQEIEGGADE